MGISNIIKNPDFHIYKLNLALFLQTMLLLSPVMLLFYNENGLSAYDLFFFQSIFYLISILFEIPIGYLVDNIPKKMVLFLSVSILFIVNLFWLMFHGYYVILIGEILFAISKVARDNAESGYLYEFLKKYSTEKDKKMVYKYGHLNFCLALGTAISGILGTFLYVKFNSSFTIIVQLFIFAFAMFLMMSLPKDKVNIEKISFRKRVEKQIECAKMILKNESIMYYVYYSGIFTTFSIMFALSFQPLMKNSYVPIMLFGIVAFLNHGVRAVASLFAGKLSNLFNLRQMIIPLFVLYFLAFLFIFVILNTVNTALVIFLIFIICLIIGFQLLFTIRHVSRLHKFVTSEHRGNIIAINNFYSRLMTCCILFISKFFMEKIGFEKFFIFAFIIFIVIGFTLMMKIYSIKEEI